MNTQTKRLEKDVRINNQELIAYFNVTATLKEETIGYDSIAQDIQVIECEDIDDLDVFDEEGDKVVNEQVLTEVYNQINSENLSEKFEFSDFN